MDPAKVYDTDVVTWAERQAALLRRMAAGERVNDQVDWENVIEEVESVGRSEVETVMSLLINVMDHKLRLIGWPDHAGGEPLAARDSPLARPDRKAVPGQHAHRGRDEGSVPDRPAGHRRPHARRRTVSGRVAGRMSLDAGRTAGRGEAVLHYRSPPHP